MKPIQSPKTQVPKIDAAQTKAFRKAARDLGCDDSEERFQNALRTVAKHKTTAPLKKEKLP